MIILDRKFVCFSPPKTGTMFRYKRYRHLCNICSIHPTYINVRDYFMKKNDDIDNYYKCVVVRNPWERRVSFFRMFYRDLPTHEQQKVFKEKVTGTDLKPMHDHYMYDDHVCVDKIYQFENFESTIHDMDSRLGVDSQIEPHDKEYSYEDYKPWFDQEMVDLIAEKEHKTIDLVGYTF